MFAILKQWYEWLFVLALLGLLGGCVVHTETKGSIEMGIRYGTEIAFFSRSAATAPEAATSRTEVTSQPLLDYLAKDAKAEEADTPNP